jgi:hypothetical protein
LTILFLFGCFCQLNGQKLHDLEYLSEAEYRLFNQGMLTQNDLLFLMAVDANHRKNSIELPSFIDRMDDLQQETPNRLKFLEELFYNTARQFFREESAVSTFNQMINQGRFNCVSGTALLSYLLHRYEIPHMIIETPGHVFTLLEEEGRKIVMESTMPKNGFLKSKKEVSSFLKQFQAHTAETTAGCWDFQFTKGLTGVRGMQGASAHISLRHLAGLQYYNDALVRLKDGQVDLATRQIKKAEMLYPSERIKRLKNALKEAF